MKRSVKVIFIVSICIMFFQVFPVWGEKDKRRIEWTGKLKDGTVITEIDLKKILKEHQKLYEIRYWMLPVNKGKNNVFEDRRRDFLSSAFRPLANLVGANLSGVNLYGANLAGANLEDANLMGAKLSGAILSGANLKNANLNSANLNGADLSPASVAEIWFGSAVLNGANLRNADLSESDLSYAKLAEADLSGAYLIQANVSFADMYYAQLNGANLDEADLVGVDLFKADLSRGSFQEANLRGSDLTYTDLRFANLKSANLRGAVLRDTNLTNAILYNTIFIGDGLPEISVDGVMTRRDSERLNACYITLAEWKNLLIEGGFYNMIKSSYNLLLFDLTGQYGLKPGRPLIILLCLIPYFAIFYIFALKTKDQKTGVWLILPNECAQEMTIKKRPFKLTQKFPPKTLPSGLLIKITVKLTSWYRMIKIGFYFSLLSALNIGWRDFNVGSIITRLQQRDYELRATGWVRTLSGIQSLISIILLTLWLLITFWHPF